MQKEPFLRQRIEWKSVHVAHELNVTCLRFTELIGCIRKHGDNCRLARIHTLRFCLEPTNSCSKVLLNLKKQNKNKKQQLMPLFACPLQIKYTKMHRVCKKCSCTHGFNSRGSLLNLFTQLHNEMFISPHKSLDALSKFSLQCQRKEFGWKAVGS